MAVFKRTTSRGESEFYHYKFMSNGKYFTGVCKGCKAKREAEKYELEIKNQANQIAKQKTIKALVENYKDELTGGDKIKLEDAFGLSLKKPRKKQPSEQHTKVKCSYWRDFMSFMQNKYPEIEFLNAVQKKHAEEYIQYIRTNGRFDKEVVQNRQGKNLNAYTKAHNLSNKSCNEFQNVITEVFQLLQTDAGLIENPFIGIPKMDNDSETREAFSEEELKRIAVHADDFIHPIFTIGIATALREGDICTLKWSEIDLERNIITRKMLKTKRTVEIPILPPLKEYLFSLKTKANGNEYVLPGHAEIYLRSGTRTQISSKVKRFLENLGIRTTKKVQGRSREISIKDVHSLRHTFCYYAGVYGIPFLIVRDICGHVNEKMTELYQKHASVSLKREKLLQMPDFMGLLPDQAIQKDQAEDQKREKLKNLLDSLPLKKIEELLKITEQ